MSDKSSLNVSSHPTARMSHMNVKTERQTSGEYDTKSESNDRIEGNTYRNRFLSAWNNMRYGLTSPSTTTFSERYPIWLLGKCYTFRNTDIEETFRSNKRTEEFSRHFSSLMWFTYRKDFPQLGHSDFTTDTGWGCMIRSAQMMLATGFLYHFVGRDFRLSGRCHSKAQIFLYRTILKLFNDSPGCMSPFSLHKLVNISTMAFGKQAGDWYGPSLVAHIIKRAMEESTYPILQSGKGLCVYVSQDCTIYKDDVARLCKNCGSCNKQCSEDHWRSLIILVPVRLGGETLNPIYKPCVQALLTLDSCIGIIGGRPKHSLYFVGLQEDSLIYLDPHFCQPSVDMSTDDFPTESFHCDSPRKMPLRKMDPSCTIGFYCETEMDFEKFCAKATEVVSPPMQKGSYPMFIVASGNCNKVMPNSADLFSSLSFSASQTSTSRSEFLESSDCTGLPHNDVHRNGEMYRVQEVCGENLVLGDGPAEDYVVLGTVKKWRFGDK